MEESPEGQQDHDRSRERWEHLEDDDQPEGESESECAEDKFLQNRELRRPRAVSPGIIDVSETPQDDSDAQYSPISSYLRGLQSSQNLYHLDSDAEFEAITITNWIVDMLALRLPLDTDAVKDVLQNGLASIAVRGFITSQGPWKHRLVFFYQSTSAKKMSQATKKAVHAEHEAAVRECKEMANVIFKQLDADGSGDIDRDELKVGFPDMNTETIDRLIRDCALDAEAISLENFHQFCLRNAGLTGPVGSKRLTLANVDRETLKDDGHCVYFLRTGTGRLQLEDFLSLVSCGEFCGEKADATGGWLSELFLPMLKQPVAEWSGWGLCKEEDAADMVESLTKLLAKLEKVALDASLNVDMAEPDHKMLFASRNTAMSASDARVVHNHCEVILNQWISVIEPLLKESVAIVAQPAGPGGSGGVDVQGPMEEIEWWKNRLLRLEHISKQMLTPACRHVLQVNAHAHTKAMRKWKGVEIRLHDTLQHTHETVALLAALETQLLPLCAPRPCIQDVTNTETVKGIVHALQQLCLHVRAYQTEAMINQVFRRVVRLLVTTIKHAICRDQSASKAARGRRLTRDKCEESDGPQALWVRDKQDVLQDVRSAKYSLEALSAEIKKALTSLQGRLNKPSSKHVLELHAGKVLLDVEGLIFRFDQLAGIFDAWSRYEQLAAMHVDAAMPAVQKVLGDFAELTDVLTQGKTRGDALDAVEKHGGFYYDVALFHNGLVKLDERLWQALEQAVGATDLSLQPVGENVHAVRPLCTSDALALMKKFEAVSSRSDTSALAQAHEQSLDETGGGGGESAGASPSGAKHITSVAWKGVEKLYFSILRRLLEDVREVQDEYQMHKHKAPKIRNVSPVLQHVLWAQQLQRKVQKIKSSCMSMPPALKLAALFRKVTRIVCTTEDTLSEYLSRWYSAWVETVEITKSGLNATLLAQHPLTLQLSVNFDQGISELMRDAKGFQRAGYPVPQAAQKVLQREHELKTYNAALTEMMKKYHDSIQHIPTPLRQLLANVVEDLERKLEPGRSTLTWMSVNIDAFLSSIEAGIADLNELVDKASEILTQKIERTLKRVMASSLMDISNEVTYTLGSGGLETFVEDQCRIIHQRAARMGAAVREAEEAVERLVSLVPTPYAFHTRENHYERDLKIRLGYMAYQATRGCVLHTLSHLKNRLVAGPTGLFYITRPIFDVDVELQYPVVALVPSLQMVQEAVNDVVLHCIEATKSFSMWGATRSEREREHLLSSAQREARSMHVHIARDRLILKQLVMLAGGMQVLKDLVAEYIEPFHKYDYLWKTDKASAIEAFCLESRIPYAVIQRPYLTLGAQRISATNTLGSSVVANHSNDRDTKGVQDAGQEESRVTRHLRAAAGARPTWDGLRMVSFLAGIQGLAEQLDDTPVLSRAVLDAIRAEMQAQWVVEQEVASILPVHNIGALSLDTISLKNVLRAESRAFKMLYAQMMLMHVHGLLKGMLRDVERISVILHERPKKSETHVLELVQVVCALSDAEEFEKRHEGTLATVQNVLDWTSECSVSADAPRLDLDKLRGKLAAVNARKPVCRREVAQQREKMMGQLALDTEAVEKDTDALAQDLLHSPDGPLVPDMPTDQAHAKLMKLKPRLEGLEKRWLRIKDAQRALQLPPSKNTTFNSICTNVSSLQTLFTLHFEASEKLEPILLQPISAMESHFDALHREQAVLRSSLQALASEVRETEQQSVSQTLTYEKLSEKLNRMAGNLDVLQSQDTALMQAYHWQAVFEKANSQSQKAIDSFEIASFKVSALEVSDYLSPEGDDVQGAAKTVLIKDVMAHDLSGANTIACLERMNSLASQEKDVRKLLQFLELHWRGEEWVFRIHMTSSGKKVFVVDYSWAAETVQELERSVLALSVQVAAMAMGSNDSRHAPDEDSDAEADGEVSQLQVEVETWRGALISSSRCVQELVAVQNEWTALQCLYHDPAIRLKQPKETRQFLLAEQQLLAILRQMKEAGSLIHYCGSRDPLALLVPLHDKLDALAKTLSTSLDQERCLFPRLFFLEDKDMIALQYSCFNDVSKLKDFLPMLFAGVRDISWAPRTKKGSSALTPASSHATEIRAEDGQERLALNSQRFPPKPKKLEPAMQARITVLSRTMSGRFHVPSEHEQKPDDVSQVRDPRMARHRPDGVVDSSGQIMLFLQPSGDEEEADDAEGALHALPSGHADESKLHRFLQLVLSRTSEQMKQDFVEARDKLLLASDKDWSMRIDHDQLQAIIASHCPQSIHLSLRMLWTAGVEQRLEHSQASSSVALSRYLEGASTGLVTTVDALVSCVSRLRLLHVHLMRRVAGIVCLLLNLRDKTDELLAGAPELTHPSDFAWFKVPRFYWDTYRKNAWMSILDTTQPCREEWQGSNPPIIVLTPSAERALMGITQAASNGKAALLLGPAATGKKSALQLFSHLCGNFLSHNLCREEMSIATIERLVKGIELATDAWLVLDHLPRLPLPLLLAASSQLHVLFQRTSSLLGTTAGVSVTSEGVAGGISVGPMVVVSSTAPVHQRAELPPSLRAVLRPVTLAEPDQLHIVQVMLAAYGVHEYASTARKLSEFVTAFNMHPLLLSARSERGLPMAVKIASAAIKFHIKSRSTATSEALVRAAVEEVLPQLTGEEHAIVDGLFADLIGAARSSELPAHTSLYPESVTHNNLDLLWGPMGLKQVPLMKSVAIRLLESCNASSLLVVSGASRSGKTTALHMVAPLLVMQNAPLIDPQALARSFLHVQHAGSTSQRSCEAEDQRTGLLTRVSMVRMDASSMSWSRFAGASQSSDGCDVFSDQWRQLMRATSQPSSGLRQFMMLVLDGHCPATWLESIIASTQINNQTRGRRTGMAQTWRKISPFLSETGSTEAPSTKPLLVLEAAPQSFHDANPSWASFSFVHMDPGCVGPDVIIHNWVQTHPLLYQRHVAKQLGIFFPSVHAFVSTQIPLASEAPKDPSFAMESCLHLLDAILADCHARGHVALAAEEGEVGDTEVLERFMVWCLTWGVAGTAVDKEARKLFSQFVCNSTSIETPVSSGDDLALHDWAIDLDTGLWVRWGSVKEDEAKHLGCGTLGCVSTWLLPTPEFFSFGFLITILTARARPRSVLQMDPKAHSRRQESAHHHHHHHAVGVYVLGEASTGKTLLMNALLCGLEETGSCVVGRWNGHIRASAASVQSTLENILQPRSSGDLAPLPAIPGSLGGQKERFGVLFLDDIHLAPVAESDNVWSLLRQLISERYVFPLAPSAGLRKFPWVPIRHMAYVVAKTSRQFHPRSTTMGTSSGAHDAPNAVGAEEAWSDSEVGRAIRSRSLNSFVHLNMLPPTRNETLAILSRGLRAHFTETWAKPDIVKLMDSVCAAALMTVESLGGVLRSSRPACAYAQMDLRKVAKIALSMCRMRGDQLLNKREAIMLFTHETRQILCESLMRQEDKLACLKQIAQVCAKVFTKENQVKNKRALQLLENAFLRDVQNIEYAYVTSAQAANLPRQSDLKNDDALDPSMEGMGVEDIHGAAVAEHEEDQGSSAMSDGGAHETCSSQAEGAGQSRQYAMIRGPDGAWLVELHDRIPFLDLEKQREIERQSDEMQLLILDLLRKLPRPPSEQKDEHGVQVQRAHAISAASPRIPTVKNNAAFEHIHPKDALVLVEGQKGSCALAVELACTSLDVSLLRMDELICESDRQKLVQLPWDSDGTKGVCNNVLVTICSRIAEHCALDNSPLVLMCPQQVAVPDLVVPLMHIMLHGHVLDRLVASQSAQIVAQIQQELEYIADDFEAKKPLLDPQMRARMLISRRMVKNFQLVLTLQSDFFMRLDWTGVYDYPMLDPSACGVLSLQAAAECIFKDGKFFFAAHTPSGNVGAAAIMTAPATAIVTASGSNANVSGSNANAKQSFMAFASESVVRSFEQCGFGSFDPKMKLVTAEIVGWLISLTRDVLKFLSSNASDNVAGMGLEHFATRFIEEFARAFACKGASLKDSMQRRSKAIARLSRAQHELEDLNNKIKIQVGLSVSVKLVISSSLNALQVATSNTERFRSQINKRLLERGEKELSFFQSLGAQGHKLMAFHEEILLCQQAFQSSVNKLNFDAWMLHTADERNQEREDQERDDKIQQEAVRQQKAKQRWRHGAAVESLEPCRTARRSKCVSSLILDALHIILHLDEEEPISVTHVQKLAQVDPHWVNAEDLELLAPFVESRAFALHRNNDDFASCSLLQPDHAGYVGLLLSCFLEALFHYSASIQERERQRRKRHAAAQQESRARYMEAIGQDKFTRPRSRSPSHAKAQVQQWDSQALTPQRMQLLEEDERLKEQQEIIRLRSQLAVSEQTMLTLQQKLDEAIARKLRIMAETFRLRSALRSGNDALKWIREQQEPYQDDQPVEAPTMDAGEHARSRIFSRSSRGTKQPNAQGLEHHPFEMMAAAVRKIAVEASLVACLLVYCPPLGADNRERLLDDVWLSAITSGLIKSQEVPELQPHSMERTQAAAEKAKAVLAANPRTQSQHALVDELTSLYWQRVVLDSSIVVSCQILTFGAATPLILDPHGVAIEWLRSMSHLWSTSDSELHGKPQSNLVSSSSLIFPEAQTEASDRNRHVKQAELKCEGSIKNLPKALKMLALAAEQGLVALLHDVDSLSAFNQVPSDLLLPDHRRPYSQVLSVSSSLKFKDTFVMNGAFVRRKTMDVCLGEGFEMVTLDEGFRLVLVSNARTMPHGIMGIKDVNVISFDLADDCIQNLLLNRVVRLENASLRDKIDSLNLESAQISLHLSRLNEQLLTFLSASDGELITDSGEMSQLSTIRKMQQKAQQEQGIVRERLSAECRSAKQFQILADAAADVYTVLCKLMVDSEDKHFRVGLPVIEAVISQTLLKADRTDGPDRLAQAAAAIRSGLHRTVSLGLEKHHRRLFTLQLCMHHMASTGMAGKEEVTMLVALCTHRKDTVQAANVALEAAHERELERASERDRERGREREEQGFNLKDGKAPERVLGASHGRSTATARAESSSPHRATTGQIKSIVDKPDSSKRRPHDTRAHADKDLHKMDQPSELSWLDPIVWDELLQLSLVWPSLAALPLAIYEEAQMLGESDGSKPYAGAWYQWIANPKPEMWETPALVTSSNPLDENRRAHATQALRPADRLLVLAVLRRDRLNQGLDRLIEAVLGPTFLQVSTSSLTLTDEATPASVLGDFAKLSMQLNVVPLPAILVQVAVDEAVGVLSHLATAAAGVRATLVVRNLAADGRPASHSSPAESTALGQLTSWKEDAEAQAGKDCPVWLVIMCAPLTRAVAEAIAIFMADAEQRRVEARFALAAPLASNDQAAAVIDSLSSHAVRSKTSLSSHAVRSNDTPGEGREVLVWLLVDHVEKLSLPAVRSCPSIFTANVLGRCLGAGGGVPAVSVSVIAAELFAQLFDKDWMQQGAGKGPESEELMWQAVVSLCVMHATVLERKRFVGGWLLGCSIVSEDFKDAVNGLRRALNVYTSRSQQVDWKMVRAMVAQYYSSLENNGFDGRMLVSLLYKHFHRGIVNVRHEMLPGLSLPQVQGGRAGKVMSAVIKSLRANANKDRVHVIGLNTAAVQAQALHLDESVMNWLSQHGEAGQQQHRQLYALHASLALPAPYVPPDDSEPDYASKAAADSRTTRRRAGNASRDAPASKVAVMSLEKQAEMANLAAQKRLKGTDFKSEKRPISPKRGDLKPAHMHDTVGVAGKSKDKDANKDKDRDKKDEDGGLSIRSDREQRIADKVQALEASLPKIIAPTSYLKDGPLEASTDVLKQHLALEVQCLNAILERVSLSLTRMASLLLGYCGSNAAAHMQELLPDLIAVDNGQPPEAWLIGCAPSWDTPSLDAWMETVQTAHMQLYQWALQGCLRSYYLPALLYPFVFVRAAKLHMSRRPSSSRLEVVPLEEAIIVLSPTKKMHPRQLAPARSSVIHVHGLVLRGGALDRNVLSDPRPGQSSSPLPVMQFMSMQTSSLQAAWEISMECPVMARVQPHVAQDEPRRARGALNMSSQDEASGHLISIVMPLENGQDQQRAVLRGVHAVFDVSPNRDSLVSDLKEEPVSQSIPEKSTRRGRSSSTA